MPEHVSEAEENTADQRQAEEDSEQRTHAQAKLCAIVG